MLMTSCPALKRFIKAKTNKPSLSSLITIVGYTFNTVLNQASFIQLLNLTMLFPEERPYAASNFQ